MNECKPSKDFKTMSVVADFNELRTIEDYKKAIFDKVSHLDIGLVCLNAGYADMGPFHVIDNVEVEKQMQVNAVHVLYTLKVLIGKLVDRYDLKKLKSGVVITSSIGGLLKFCGISTYSAVKAFDNHLA